jgi:hypothetical protein
MHGYDSMLMISSAVGLAEQPITMLLLGTAQPLAPMNDKKRMNDQSPACSMSGLQCDQHIARLLIGFSLREYTSFTLIGSLPLSGHARFACLRAKKVYRPMNLPFMRHLSLEFIRPALLAHLIGFLLPLSCDCHAQCDWLVTPSGAW